MSQYGTHIGVVLTILMLSVLFQEAKAQQNTTRENRTVGIWRTYRPNVDGLTNNAVFSVLQTTGGAIWFGTQDGISRFDGRNWIGYTQKDCLAGATVRTLIEDGLRPEVKCNPAKVSFGSMGRTGQQSQRQNGLPNNTVSSIMQDIGA